MCLVCTVCVCCCWCRGYAVWTLVSATYPLLLCASNFTVNAQHIRYIAIRYTIELKKTQVASLGDVLGVHCVCMLLLVQGVCCLDIGFRHISLAPLRIKFHRECSAQKIYCHAITFTCLLRLNSTDTIKVALLPSFVHVFNITFPKW